MKKKTTLLFLTIIILFISASFGFKFMRLRFPVFYKENFRFIDTVFKDTRIIKNSKEYSKEARRINILKNYYRNNSPKRNASKYIKTSTSDRFKQAVHPDMLYFNNGYKGYKYFLTFTPYPFSKDMLENPHLLVSNDGISFRKILGGKNPIAPLPEDIKTGGHLSDTDIVFNDNKFIVHYVYNKKGRNVGKILKIESKDAVNWSKPEKVYEPLKNTEIYSPAFIAEGKTIKMWYMKGENKFYYTQSVDKEKTWDKEIKCNLNMGEWKPWHVDVIKTERGYEGLMCAKLYSIPTRALFYIHSLDGINWETSKIPIIFPSKNNWDSVEIYRATMIKENGVYRIWYSARGRFNIWHIGYTKFMQEEIDKLL